MKRQGRQENEREGKRKRERSLSHHGKECYKKHNWLAIRKDDLEGRNGI